MCDEHILGSGSGKLCAANVGEHTKPQICSNLLKWLKWLEGERERERERERTGASKAQAQAIKSRPRTPLSRVLTTNNNKIKGDFADFIQVNMQRICKLIPPGDQDQT
jgi:hypothetical protein